VSPLWSLHALEEHGGVGAELVNHLAACAAGRTRHSPVVDYRNRQDLNLWTKLCHGRENRSTLGAVGHSVGGIFHIAARKNSTARQENRSTNPEVRIWGMRVLHHFLCRPQQSCRYISRECFLAHRVCLRTVKSRAIVNPDRVFGAFNWQPSSKGSRNTACTRAMKCLAVQLHARREPLQCRQITTIREQRNRLRKVPRLGSPTLDLRSPLLAAAHFCQTPEFLSTCTGYRKFG